MLLLRAYIAADTGGLARLLAEYEYRRSHGDGGCAACQLAGRVGVR